MGSTAGKESANESPSSIIVVPRESHSSALLNEDSQTQVGTPKEEQPKARMEWKYAIKFLTFSIAFVICLVLGILFFYVEGDFDPSQCCTQPIDRTRENTTINEFNVDAESSVPSQNKQPIDRIREHVTRHEFRGETESHAQSIDQLTDRTREKISTSEVKTGSRIKFSIVDRSESELVLLITISFVIALAITFFKCVRVIALLTLQGMTTSRGRAIMLTIIIRMLLTGPIANTLDNAKKIKETISCQVSMFSDELKDMQSALLLRIREYSKETARKMLPLQIETLKSIISDLPLQTIERVFSNLKNIKITIDTSDLNPSLTVRNVTFYGHDVVNYTNNIDATVYSERPTVTGVEGLLAIGGKLIAAFNDMTYVSRQIVYVLEFLLSVPVVVLVVLQACYYLWGFLHNLDFDNMYITSAFKKFDKENDKLLPLRKKERAYFIDSTTVCLSKQEIIGIFRGLFIILSLLAIAILLCGVDFLFYIILEVVRKEANMTILIQGGTGFQVVLNDTSPSINQLLHQEVPTLFMSNSTNFNYSLEISTAPCLPDPLPPFYKNTYKLTYLAAMYIGITILTLVQSYGVRVQHKITERYYPKRFKERVEYLYKFLVFHRQKAINRRQRFGLWLKSSWRRVVRKVRAFCKSEATCETCGFIKKLKRINSKWQCPACCCYEMGYVYRPSPKCNIYKS